MPVYYPLPGPVPPGSIPLPPATSSDTALIELTDIIGFREETIDIAFESPVQVSFKIAGQRADDPPLDVMREYTYTRNNIRLAQGYIKILKQKLGNRVDEQTYVLMDRYADLKKELLVKYGTTRFTINPDRDASNPIPEEDADFTPIWTVVPLATGFWIFGGPSFTGDNATGYLGSSLGGMAENIILENQLYQMYIAQNASNDSTVSSFMAGIGDFVIPDDVSTFKKAIEFFVKDSDVIEGQNGVKVLWFNDPEGILDTKIENNIALESRFIGEIIEEFLRYVPTVRFYYSPQLKQLVAVNLKAGAGKVVRLNRMFTNHFERHQQLNTPYSDVMEVDIDIDETNCYQSIHLEGSGYFGKVTRTLIPQFPYSEYVAGAGCEGSLYAADLMYGTAYTLFGKAYKFPSVPSPYGFDGGTYSGSGAIEILAMAPFANRYSCINDTEFININMFFTGFIECCGQMPHVWNDWRWFKLYEMNGDVKLNSEGNLVIVSPIRLMHGLNIFGFTRFGDIGDVFVPEHGHHFSPTGGSACVDFTAITEWDGDKCNIPMGPMFVPWVLAARYWEKRGPLSVYLTGGCFNGRTFTRFNKDWAYALNDDQINDPSDNSGWPHYGGDEATQPFRAPTFRAKEGFELDFTYGSYPVGGEPNQGVYFTNPPGEVETIDPDAIFNEHGGVGIVKDDRDMMAKFASNLADVLFVPRVNGTIKLHLFLNNEQPAGTDYNPPLTSPEVNPFGNFGETWILGDRLSIEYDQYETQGPGEVPTFGRQFQVSGGVPINGTPIGGGGGSPILFPVRPPYGSLTPIVFTGTFDEYPMPGPGYPSNPVLPSPGQPPRTNPLPRMTVAQLANVDPATWDKLNISVVGLHYNRYDQTLTLDVANSAYAYGDRILEGLQR